MSTPTAGDLSGRVALVTGSSDGLGFASAQALATRGARVALSSRGGKKLERARERMASEGADVIAVSADIRHPKELATLIAAVQEGLGPIDILVANGGGPRARPAVELDEEDWADAIALTFLFVPRLCRLVLPGMRKRGWGRIVAINSVSTRQPIAGLALSNALRPAVVGYLKTLSQEVAADGVTVNSVLPGYTRTQRQVELAQAMAERTGEKLETVLAQQGGPIPIGRMAQPHEIGAVVGFLCSPEASYLTGQAITVDGGYVRSLM